jgi:regulator of replication initiation timing
MTKSLKTRYTHTEEIVAHQTEPKKYTGVLFRFGELSKNGTGVKRTAKVRACSDVINVEHDYPDATEYKAAGHIDRFYYLNDALYIDFHIYDEFYQNKVEDETLALSVSWFSDSVEVIDGDQWFDDIVIYEVSLVGIPAFNTCAAPEGEPLACMNNVRNCGCGGGKGKGGKQHKDCKCNGEKNSDVVYLNDMTAKHQEEERIAALEQSVQKLIEDWTALQQQVADLTGRLEALEQGMAQMREQAEAAIEEAKQVASKVEGIMGDIAKNEHSLSELAKLTHRLTTNLANLIRK